MSLLEKARAKEPIHPGPTCAIRKAVDRHPELAGDVLELMQGVDINHTLVSDTLRAAGIHASPDTIGRHRAGRCLSCTGLGFEW